MNHVLGAHHAATVSGDVVLIHAGPREACAECSTSTIRDRLTRGETFARELRERAAREAWARSG